MWTTFNKKSQIQIVLILILLIGIFFFFFRTSNPNDSAERAEVNIVKDIGDKLIFQGVRNPIDISKSYISFEGFGPGKSHVGRFNEWSGELYIEDKKIIGFEGIIQSKSIDAKMNILTNHLKSTDFLNVEKYPKIKFVSKKLEENVVTGDLTFLGITKEINFPVIINEDSISADFILDTSEFRDKDNETSKSSWLLKANDEVRIFFELYG